MTSSEKINHPLPLVLIRNNQQGVHIFMPKVEVNSSSFFFLQLNTWIKNMHCDIVQPYPSIFIQFSIISYSHLTEIHACLLDGDSL